jgi:hypothetical protein
MPLEFPEPPAQAGSVLRETVRSLAGERRLRTPALRVAQPDALELSDPHETFTLGLDDLRAGPGLAAAHPSGWRYLVRAGGRAVAAAHSAGTDRGEQVLSQVNEGPFVAATEEALDAARSTPRVEQRSYTPRLLSIPALHAVALWLHDGGDDDLLVPLQPFPLDVPAGQPVPAGELLGRLAEAARAAEAGDDRTGG